jgi:hypothetical protein
MIDVTQHAITGLVTPDMGEVRIRDTWPSVAAAPAIASVGRALTRTIILAPLAWMIMAAVYFAKVLPFTARRYFLTNKRVLIRRGWSGKIAAEAALDRITDVKVVTDDNTEFFRAAALHIMGDGAQPLLVLPAVPEPENFRRAILDARDAWHRKA